MARHKVALFFVLGISCAYSLNVAVVGGSGFVGSRIVKLLSGKDDPSKAVKATCSLSWSLPLYWDALRLSVVDIINARGQEYACQTNFGIAELERAASIAGAMPKSLLSKSTFDLRAIPSFPVL